MPALSVEGYRAFRDRTDLRLRPLTLLFGHNQAGKSTLLRLLVAIADSVFERVRVLDLSSPALLGSSLKELGWLGPEPRFSPRIRLSAPDTRSFVEIHLTDDRGVVPNRIQTGRNPDQIDFDVSWAGGPSLSGPQQYSAQFEGRANQNSSWQGLIQFESLLPNLPDAGDTAQAARQIADVRSCLDVLKHIQWLCATRPLTSANPRRARCSLPDGSDLPGLLEDRRDVIAMASEWLSGPSGPGETLKVGRDGEGSPHLVLQSSGEELPSHLAGEGVRWLLPVLLSACWAECGGPGAPTILAIEEMEARLHPNLQLSLMDKLIGTVSAGIPCVLETHSIYLLRRIQLAVLEGRLRPEDVAIYWIERSNQAARMRPVEIQDDGTLKGWNPETFEEEQQLSRKILQARWARAGGALRPETLPGGASSAP
jgi:hypothetical protein